MDLLIRSDAASVVGMVAVAVMGVGMPSPVTVAVFTIVPSGSGDANSFTVASYTKMTLPSAGTLKPVITRGGPAVTEGVACRTPFTK